MRQSLRERSTPHVSAHVAREHESATRWAGREVRAGGPPVACMPLSPMDDCCICATRASGCICVWHVKEGVHAVGPHGARTRRQGCGIGQWWHLLLCRRSNLLLHLLLLELLLLLLLLLVEGLIVPILHGCGASRQEELSGGAARGERQRGRGNCTRLRTQWACACQCVLAAAGCPL
jgi:hypothetical protein